MKKLKIVIMVAMFAATFSLMGKREYKFETTQEEIVSKDVDQPIESVVDKWDKFIEAVIWKESKGDANAIGDSGKAVGVLQIHPIMVREANRILAMKDESKTNYYKYDDRYSREKSIEIFKIVQDYHNVSHDFDKALQIWNKNHPSSYKNEIMAKYKELTI